MVKSIQVNCSVTNFMGKESSLSQRMIAKGGSNTLECLKMASSMGVALSTIAMAINVKQNGHSM